MKVLFDAEPLLAFAFDEPGADAHIADLERLGVAEYGIDGVWRRASDVKAEHGLPLGDAYAVAAAEAEDAAGSGVTLVVGADDDYDELEGTEEFGHLIERFREESW